MSFSNMLKAVLFLLSIPTVLSHPSPQHETWTALASITVAPRQEHTAFFLQPSTIGILGGVVPNGTWFATTDLMQFYSIRDDSWRTATLIPKPLNHVNAVTSRGKLYVLGGLADTPEGNWAAIPDAWVYNQRKNSWTAIAPMPVGEARGSAAVGVYKNLIILAGGITLLNVTGDGSEITVDTVSIFDTSAGKWVEVPEAAKTIPEGRDHAGAAVVGDKMYILGGRKEGKEHVQDTVFILDICDMAAGWTISSARMPTARGGLSTGVIENKIYTFGGEGNQNLESGVFNETEVYDPIKDSWERLGSMEVPRHGTSAVAVGDAVYIPGGGIRAGGGPVSTFDVFRPGAKHPCKERTRQ
ncbi:kelch repeat-containing protein [Clohesyomyces aquaticus]|uniref:Kelch repeat-containing protein n=1 Tax=Clohesyomyces aquaticus TaxID=1231657 RepID=A0A1Y1YQI7_9PLEO|nr:kelch repeat-containing protein [Clohesyomyces aquaticus]